MLWKTLVSGWRHQRGRGICSPRGGLKTCGYESFQLCLIRFKHRRLINTMLAFGQIYSLHLFFKNGLGDCRCMDVEGYVPKGPTYRKYPIIMYALIHTSYERCFILFCDFQVLYIKRFAHSENKKELNICSSKEHLCGQR